MNNFLLIFIYSIFLYGISNLFVFGSGPFKIFEAIRFIADKIGKHFGQMFKCMMCFPANVGLAMSLLNRFLFTQTMFTPGNIIFNSMENSFLNIAFICVFDCCYSSGIVWLIHHFEEFFENIAEGNQ